MVEKKRPGRSRTDAPREKPMDIHARGWGSETDRAIEDDWEDLAGRGNKQSSLAFPALLRAQ
jgi:hypothetical protein